MSLKFVEVEKPAGITAFPASLKRPAFGALYGFDVPQEEVIVFPTIQVFDNESEFIDQTDAPNYTIVYAKDTDRLYVWHDSEQRWYIYEQDSSV